MKKVLVTGAGGFIGNHVQNLTFEKINSSILPLMC